MKSPFIRSSLNISRIGILIFSGLLSGCFVRYRKVIVTSRIVGYEAGSFANSAHYTLQDLEEWQINQFLTKWCPLVERHQKSFVQGMRKLTPLQKRQADKEGKEQRDRLWEALQGSPGIKRLAVNPLMLTILALIQRSGKTLPHHRIDLYQMVTRTLLDNWNQETGRRFFPVDEIPLAEEMLACFASELHSTDRLLTEAKVKEIANRVMTAFYKQAPKETTINQFLDTLRRSGGLFVESGQGFFSFMHRTFQEYYAARYLLNQPFDKLQAFVRTECLKPLWHEPFLLLIAYKSIQSNALPPQGYALSTFLLALYSILRNYDTISPQVTQKVQQSLQQWEQQFHQSFTMEHRQLIAVLRRLITPSSSSAGTQMFTPQGTPDERATSLYAFKQQRELTGAQVEELLQTYADVRALSDEKKKEVENADTVHEVAWGLLEQQFILKDGAVPILTRYVEDKHPLVCAAAARLLKSYSRRIPQPARKEAAQKVMEILRDDELSRRPLDTPDDRQWQLNDLLFETLKALVE